jgi:hypothetical protein
MTSSILILLTYVGCHNVEFLPLKYQPYRKVEQFFVETKDMDMIDILQQSPAAVKVCKGISRIYKLCNFLHVQGVKS